MKYVQLRDKPDNIRATRNTDESKVKKESENIKSLQIKDVIGTFLDMQGFCYRYLPSYFIFCNPSEGIRIGLALLDILPEHYKTSVGCSGNQTFSDEFLKFGVNDICITELAESTKLTGPTKAAELMQPSTKPKERKETLFNFLCRQLVENRRLQNDTDENDWNIWKGKRDCIIDFTIILAKHIAAGCWIPDTEGVYPIHHIMKSQSFKGGIKHDIFRIYELLIEFLLDRKYQNAVQQEWQPYFDELWNCNDGAYFTYDPYNPDPANPDLKVATWGRNVASYTAKFLFQILFVIGIKIYRENEINDMLWKDSNNPSARAINIDKWAMIEGLACVLAAASYYTYRRPPYRRFDYDLQEAVNCYSQKLFKVIFDHEFVISKYFDPLGPQTITYQTRPNYTQSKQSFQQSTPVPVATTNPTNNTTQKSDVEVSTTATAAAATATAAATTIVSAAKSITLRQALSQYLPDNNKETQAAVLLSALPEQYKTEIRGCCSKDKKTTFDGPFLDHDLNDCFITESNFEPTDHMPYPGIDIKSAADVPLQPPSVSSTTKRETLLGFICRKIKEKNDVLLKLIDVTNETNVTKEALNKLEQEINVLRRIAVHLLNCEANCAVPDSDGAYPFQHLIDSQYMSEGIRSDQKIVDMVKKMMDQLACLNISNLAIKFSKEDYTLLDLIWRQKKPSFVKETKKVAKREGYPARFLFLVHLATVFDEWEINLTSEISKYTSSTDKDEIYKMWATMIAIQDICCNETRSFNLKLVGKKCGLRLKRILLEQSEKLSDAASAFTNISKVASSTRGANDARVVAFSAHNPYSTAAAANSAISIGISKELERTNMAARSGSGQGMRSFD